MSNNKQSMKLYTEEQLKEAFNCGRLYLGREGDTNFYDLIDKLTPIELPSDDEINKNGYHDKESDDIFREGVKYVINKIQGGEQ